MIDTEFETATGRRLPPVDDSSSVNLRAIESLAIDRALKRCGGRVDSAARLLGIGRATLYRRLTEAKHALDSRAACAT